MERKTTLIAEPGDRVEVRDESHAGPCRKGLIVAVDRHWRVGGVTTIYRYVPEVNLIIQLVDDESRIRKPETR